MGNERITENLVRDILRELSYYSEENDIRVEEQKSEIETVKKLLKNSGKSGNGGKGSPEFIISSLSTPDFLVIIECKADIKNHESKHHGDPVKYAVDGALHYASNLAKEYNVIAVAVSGQTESQLIISTHIHTKGASLAKELFTKNGTSIDTIIPWEDYIEHGTYDPEVQRLKFDELMAFSRELHDFMRDHAKLTESEKPLIVSGTLMALRNKAFAKTYGDYSPEDLQKQWFHVIKEEIEKADIPNSKKHNVTQPYSSISVHPELGKSTKGYPKGVLYELVKKLNEKVWPFISVYNDYDVVGQFYGEFLKYTGGDKKALGIVLTPRHITELFAQLANVTKVTRVIDICAGTGGFLISAMHQMIKQTVTEKEVNYIKKNCLIGVEQQPNMYALAASNMILRGDGKANLYQGSCFDEGTTKEIMKKLKYKNTNGHTVGLINPPYSQEDVDLHELIFVKHMLDCLNPGGTGVAIVPMSCAISPHNTRQEILKYHTLEAVMSMPDELFYPVGTVTCIMVFTAHTAHSVANKKTWFGYWKNDGFIKTKHRGRIDQYFLWPEIRDAWLEAFRNRDEVPGLSVKKQVTHLDEWCAEAYMDTDYNKIGKEDFEKEIRNYLTFCLTNGLEIDDETNGYESEVGDNNEDAEN